MADNSHLEFRLKIYGLELDTVSVTIAQHPSSGAAAAAEKTTAAASVTDYVTRTFDAFDVSRNDIEYRAEGNANIVLAMPKRCQVLRLPKKSKSKQNICRSTAKECWQNECIFYVHKYIDRVSTLFGPNISSRPILVRIEFGNVDAFDVWLHNYRPQHRVRAKRDDFDFDYGLLYHDACSLNSTWRSATANGDVFAVEIKPKQGWDICTLDEWILDLFQISHDVRIKCRFCAMQHLKVKGQQVRRISKYCPLDLFSGDAPRMTNSIRNLIASPQNNFRVFRNGQLVYSDDYQEHVLQSALSQYFGNDTNVVDEFIRLLVSILQYDFAAAVKPSAFQANSKERNSTAAIKEDERVPLKSSHLPKCSILQRVLDLQLLAKKTMPYVAQKYINDEHGWQHLLKNNQWPYLHVTELANKLNQVDQNNVIIDYKYLKTVCKLNDEDIYEIGATALDSSIMLTFQAIKPAHNLGVPLVNLSDQQFAINATVFDLDPKLYPRHFSKYVQKTRDSFNAYKQFRGAETL